MKSARRCCAQSVRFLLCQQRHDLSPQFVVTTTRLIEKRFAFAGCA
jgi:hypothetical protein